MVYPPPPSTSSGTWKVVMYLRHSACPRMDRLKHPRRSPVRESAPDWNTTASGAYISITFAMMGLKSRLYDSSSMPSFRGTFTE